MPTLRTANHRRRKAHRRAVLVAAHVYDWERLARLALSGRLDKRVNSGYVRRAKRKAREVRKWLRS